ncbi:alpha/beta hydrolase family protein [Streptomyces sp. ASQP_92]|uniref:alpha/beta hydrolase family protein n=1 Tax=Streptomyces sp. ASQP_92 TaxID=2979116 RepID=UPI0021BE1442|nr:alpha/beta hydrolase family protein [Streptomyces sp. ASQP_92]MCT9087858.1 alpha/beta hydrolase family protein [Streptomyces sp. ASQP_92]
MRGLGRALVAAALVGVAVAGTAGWAAADAQEAVTGPPPGTAAWRADTTTGHPLPDPASASPREVAAFFGELSEPQRQALARRHPQVVGNLDGAPVALRYEANRRAIAATHDPRYTRLAAPDRQILAFDPRGRGQVAQVYGELEGAAHVSVIVPGSDIDARTFDRAKDPYGTPAGMATALRDADHGATAVIAWAGYTTPVGVGVDAASGRLAEAGAGRLARLTEGLDAVGAPDPVLFCHSYGSVVCGLAAHRTDASDIVVLGSPGMRADTVADLGTEARVWAAKDPSDWIDDVPHIEFAGLGHGTDPTDPAFGARRVPAADAKGHTGYFAPGTESLNAFAAIALGDVR